MSKMFDASGLNSATVARDRAAFHLAREYLLSFADAGVTDAIIDYYVEPPLDRLRPDSLPGVYLRVLGSAQNANMRANVVGGAIGGVEKLDCVLCSFEPREVVRCFGSEWERLLDGVEQSGLLPGPVRRTSRSIWPLFCRSALSSAVFLSQFEDAEDFYRWVEIFDGDDRIRPALPMLLSYEIDGFGFPLACDFLKELGFLNFGKPDVHLKAILGGLGLTRLAPADCEAFKEITGSVEQNPVLADCYRALGRHHDAEVLSSGLATLQAELSDLAATLSEARRLAGATLSAKVGPLLRRLGMPHAAFTVSVTESAKHTAHGTDTVEFTFSANPGEAQAPISQIASGGELSRVMLALHLVTGTVQETVAFDEIDAGIGGKAAHDVGALLAALAKGRQVLVVTHLAQVAAFADHHYVVSKQVSSGRTVTSVRRLSDAERPPELARMLSGSVTTASLAHAAELLDAARSTAAHEAVHLVE